MPKSAQDKVDRLADKLGGMAGKASKAIKKRRARTKNRLDSIMSSLGKAREAQTTDSNNR